MDKRSIGNKITTLRKDKGYTQKQLAEKLHVTDKAVSNWERGNNLPDLVMLEPLANELNTTITNLLDINEKCSINTIVEMAIDERDRFIREIRIDNFIILILYSLIFGYILYTIIMYNKYDIDITYNVQFLERFLLISSSIPFGVVLRNHIRIKKYYNVKMK